MKVLTGETEETFEPPADECRPTDPAVGGRAGGRARAAKMKPEERSVSAKTHGGWPMGENMTDEQFAALNRRFDSIEDRLGRVEDRLGRVEDRLGRVEGEVRLQRQALEQFGLMRKPQATQPA